MKDKEQENNKNMIPVYSEEATSIISKLFDKGISIFAHDNVNMPLNQNKNTNRNRFNKKY